MTVEDVTGADQAAVTADTPGRAGLAQSTTTPDQPRSSREPEPRAAESAGHPSGPELDLLVVGGGSGGFAAAIAACDQGRRVGLVNTGPLGCTCTHRGCIPSKGLIRAAEVWWRAGRHRYAGVDTAQVGLDWQAVQAQKDKLIGELRHGRYEEVLAAYPDISLLEGEAVFQPDGSVRVGGRSVQAHRYLVATGARPRRVPLPGLEQAEPLDSTTLMDLNKLPASVLVLGGRAGGRARAGSDDGPVRGGGHHPAAQRPAGARPRTRGRQRDPAIPAGGGHPGGHRRAGGAAGPGG